MKMCAYLNLKNDRESGQPVDADDIRKHRRDVFNLLATGKMNASVAVCGSIFNIFSSFVDDMRTLQSQNPKILAQSIGVPPMLIDSYLELLKTVFLLEE